MESNVKRFESELNYDEVRHSLAEAMVVLQNAPVDQESSTVSADVKVVELNTKRLEKTRRQMSYKAAGFGYAAASIFASALISGAAMVLNLNTRHT